MNPETENQEMGMEMEGKDGRITNKRFNFFNIYIWIDRQIDRPIHIG